MKAVVGTCPCAISLNHLDFRLFMFGSYTWIQDEITVSMISRQKFIVLIFKKVVRICSSCELSWSVGLLSWCTCSIYSKNFIWEANFSPSMKAVVGTWPCAISLDHLDFRLFMFCLYSRNQDEFTDSFIPRRKFIFLFFEKTIRIRS